jgi:geranylgeranyl pyrophosphate synthase
MLPANLHGNAAPASAFHFFKIQRCMSSPSWHFSPSLVEEFFERVLPQPDKGLEPARARLQRAMRAAIFSGGKRLRSSLVLETSYVASTHHSSAGNGKAQDLSLVLPAACAIEMIHAYSLVHDDLPAMDDSDTRRGRPSSHKEFGEATAILVGDALLTLAFETMTHAPEDKSTLALRAMQLLARAAGEAGMVGGQMIDIAWSNELERDHDLDHLKISGDDLLAMHALKTGALLRASCEIGGVLGEGDESTVKALSEYGAQLGRAFQLKDDLLDIEGDPEKTGKSATDAANDKITAPALFGVEETRVLAHQSRDAAFSALEIFGDQAAALRDQARDVVERVK